MNKLPLCLGALSSKTAALATTVAAILVSPLSAQWENLNPGAGGQIQRIVPDPNTDGRLFVMVDMEGIYRSDDFGTSWNYVSETLNHGMTFHVAVEPGNGNNVYAGTLFGFNKSTDGGVTWTHSNLNRSDITVYTTEATDSQLDTVGPESIGWVGIDPANKNNVYALPGWATKDAPKESPNFVSPVQSIRGKRVIYKSSDRGNNWVAEYYESVDGYRQVYNMAFRSTNGKAYIGAHSGVYVRNGATNYDRLPVPTGAEDGLNDTIRLSGCRGVAISPDGRWLYAPWMVAHTAGKPQQSDGRLYAYDLNQGVNGSWILLDTGLPVGAELANPIIDPRSTSSEHKLLINVIEGAVSGGRMGLWELTTSISGGTMNSYAWQLVGDQSTQSNTGFHYDDGWEKRKWKVRSSDYAPTSWARRDIFAAGGQNLYRGNTESAGFPYDDTWEPIYTDLVDDSMAHPTYHSRGFQSVVLWDINAYQNYTYFGGADHGVTESWDYGFSSSVESSFASSSSRFAEFAHHPGKNPLMIAHAGSGFGAGNANGNLIVKELNNLDQTDTWVKIAGGPTKNVIYNGLASEAMRDAAIDHGNPGVLYVGVDNNTITNHATLPDGGLGGLYRTKDFYSLMDADTSNDENFARISTGDINTKDIKRVFVDPNDSDVIWLGMASTICIYKGERNGGDGQSLSDWTWTQVTTGDNKSLQDFVVWDNEGVTMIAAVSRKGGAGVEENIFVSSDSGANWSIVASSSSVLNLNTPPWYNPLIPAMANLNLKGLSGHGDNLCFTASSEVYRKGGDTYVVNLSSPDGVAWVADDFHNINGTDAAGGRLWVNRTMRGRLLEYANDQVWYCLATQGVGAWRYNVTGLLHDIEIGSGGGDNGGGNTGGGETFTVTEDFETGDLNGGTGWSDASWSTGTPDSVVVINFNDPLDAEHVRIRKNGSMERGIDASGASEVIINLSVKANNYTGTEGATLDIYDGAWHQIQIADATTAAANTHAPITEVVLDAATYNFDSDFMIGFSSTGNGNSDYILVDNIVIDVVAGAPASGPVVWYEGFVGTQDPNPTTFDYTNDVLTVDTLSMGTSNSGDNLSLMFAELLGDKTMSLKVDSITGGTNGAVTGILVRDNLISSEAPMFAIYQRKDGKVMAECRRGDSLSLQSTTLAHTTQGVYLKVERVGDVFECFYRFDTASAWTSLYTHTFDPGVMNSNAAWSVVVCNGGSSTNALTGVASEIVVE